MITAWDIYWVMQLDTIGMVASLLALAGIPISAFAWAAWADENVDAPIAFPLVVTPLAILALLVATFIPSTKTAAAMIVLPAVANNETIQQEAGELYGIAKDALRELARPKPAPKPAKESAE